MASKRKPVLIIAATVSPHRSRPRADPARHGHGFSRPAPMPLALLLAGALCTAGAGAQSTPGPGIPNVTADAIGEAPQGLESMRALALELLRIEDYDGSVAVYREIVAHTPDDPVSHYDLAAALSFVQRYLEAAEPIRAAIRLDPENLKTREMAALIFLKLRWFEEAFAATLKSAQLGEPTAMYSLVNMYETGLGVEANPDKAVYWAIEAAEHGHLGAMALMEEIYRSGRLGRTVDTTQADAWANRLREAEGRID